MKRMIDDKLIKQVDDVIDNNGDLEAGKLNRKLYYHPIYFYGDSPVAYVLQCAIIDTNPTAYTKTTFKQKLKDLLDNGALINTNGCCNIEGTWYPAYIISKEESTYRVYVVTASAFNTYYTIDFDSIADIVDGVNEIYPNVG